MLWAVCTGGRSSVVAASGMVLEPAAPGNAGSTAGAGCSARVASDPAGDGRSITIKLEAQEPGVYRWDEKRYPWLNYTETFQKVVPGARATRDLPHINAANYTAHANISGGQVEFIFPGADATRAQLRSGDRVFLKHFGNKRAWGVYGWNVSGWHLNDVTLLSCAGMDRISNQR